MSQQSASATAADLAELAWPGEIHAATAADISHILKHAGIDEPTGTWTGGACPRLGRPPGTDVNLADLGEMHRQSGGLSDFTWQPEPAAADIWLRLIRDWQEDGTRDPHDHPYDWWAERVKAAWSRIWVANCRFVTEILEGPSRESGGDGLAVASFEHNSSPHGLQRPHVHNLFPMRAG
jgi:hypothetical protein